MDETTDAPATVTTRSVGIKWGLISAAVSILMFVALTVMRMGPFESKWGWVRLPISIILLVLAQKQFKDDGDGFMSYGQGFGIGFWMTLVGVVCVGLFTFIYISFIDTTVMEDFYTSQTNQMQERGMQDSQIEMAMGWTKKLFWPFFFFFGILFGLMIPLIVTIFTQKKNPQGEMV
jgi:hypothetical protein